MTTPINVEELMREVRIIVNANTPDWDDEVKQVFEAYTTNKLIEARIDEAQYIQDNFVSPGSSYCNEIGIDDIRNRIAALKETHEETPKRKYNHKNKGVGTTHFDGDDCDPLGHPKGFYS